METEIQLRPKRLFTHESDFGTSIADCLWSKIVNNQKFVNQSLPIGYVLYFYASQVDSNGTQINKPNPEIWAELDGRTINDISSPLNGVTLPDMRSRFLKGAEVEGNIGGQETINLQHNHSGLTDYTDDRTSGADGGNNHTGGSYHAHPIGSSLSSVENIQPPFVCFSAYVRYK